MMRIYVSLDEVHSLGSWLREKDAAVHLVSQQCQGVKKASDRKSWGCVLCLIKKTEDTAWLLEAWKCSNPRSPLLVQAGIVPSPHGPCLIACPDWALQDPFVRSTIRKLSGVKAPAQDLDWDKRDGVVPVIAQDAETKTVLMQAWMDEIAYVETVRTRRAVYFSTSRRTLWRKGEESGNVQLVHGIRIDCDADCILLEVEQIGGAACHNGYKSCFYRSLNPDDVPEVCEQRIFDPAMVYTK